MDTKHYTIGQSAKKLGVSKSSVRAWIREGTLKSQLDQSGMHLVSEEDLNTIKTDFSPSKFKNRSMTAAGKIPGTISKNIRAPQYPLALQEAAKFLNISKNSLLRWEKSGIIKSARTKGGARRYYPKDLIELSTNRTPYQRLPKQEELLL
jgi:DNA-binding transcriptional MerR regulator